MFKFAFSASFGQEIISEKEVEQTKKWINQYKLISVREESAINILEKQYGFENATRIIDPTLCLDADYWRKRESTKYNFKDYILIYNLNRSKDFDNYAKKISKKTGLKLLRLCTRYDQFYRVGKSIIAPQIEDFISLIDNARYVLTDSFHATAFSMNMNTEPICIYPKEFGGRIEGFLEMTKSTQRHVNDYNDFDVINRPVDFEYVNKVLEEERKKANDYINLVIKSINEYKNI